jgi:hypothetical protein
MSCASCHRYASLWCYCQCRSCDLIFCGSCVDENICHELISTEDINKGFLRFCNNRYCFGLCPYCLFTRKSLGRCTRFCRNAYDCADCQQIQFSIDVPVPYHAVDELRTNFNFFQHPDQDVTSMNVFTMCKNPACYAFTDINQFECSAPNCGQQLVAFTNTTLTQFAFCGVLHTNALQCWICVLIYKRMCNFANVSCKHTAWNIFAFQSALANITLPNLMNTTYMSVSNVVSDDETD